jgi:hypothetical protein
VRALARPSQAKIVYTPENQTLEANQALTIDLKPHHELQDVQEAHRISEQGGLNGKIVLIP